MIEDCRAVLLAEVRALTVQLRGIVVLPENIEQVFIGNSGGVVIDLDRFRMACGVGANVFVGGVLHLTADVTDAGSGYARNLTKRRFYAPETSSCESCFCHNHSFILPRFDARSAKK